jgi:hypothetical protein
MGYDPQIWSTWSIRLLSDQCLSKQAYSDEENAVFFGPKFHLMLPALTTVRAPVEKPNNAQFFNLAILLAIPHAEDSILDSGSFSGRSTTKTCYH